MLAVHNGVEPLTAARSAYRGKIPPPKGVAQQQGPLLTGGIIGGAANSSDS